jgi:hypothetical protein
MAGCNDSGGTNQNRLLSLVSTVQPDNVYYVTLEVNFGLIALIYKRYW